MGIRQFSIKSTLATFSRVKKSSRLFNFSTESTSFALSNANSLHDFLAATSLFFKSSDGLPKLSLIPLDSFLSLSISLVGMIKGNLKFIDVRFKFLLDAKGFTLGTLLTLKRSSQRFHCTSMVLPSIIELLLLLLNATINLLPYLTKLKLGSENLVLLLLKSSFSLLKGRLELLLLNLQTTALFIQFMDRAATISQLIKKI